MSLYVSDLTVSLVSIYVSDVSLCHFRSLCMMSVSLMSLHVSVSVMSVSLCLCVSDVCVSLSL